MDIASLLLSFLSFLQGIKNKQTLQDKVSALKSALAAVDSIYGLLSLAKGVHDTFEQFGNIAMDPLAESLNDEDMTQADLKSHVGKFVDRADKYLTPAAFVSWQASSFKANTSLPVEITQRIQTIDAVFPQFRKALADLDKVMAQIREAHSAESYGKHLRENVVLASHNLKRGTSMADRIILNTAYILDFIHFQLKQALDTI